MASKDSSVCDVPLDMMPAPRGRSRQHILVAKLIADFILAVAEKFTNLPK